VTRRSETQFRILHVITRLDLGGSSENTLLTVIGLQAAGYDVTIACGVTDNPLSENEKKATAMGVTIHRFATLVRQISPIKDLKALAGLYRLVRKGRYDLVHTHTSKAGIIGRIAAKLAGVRCIVHTPHGHTFYGYFGPVTTRFFIWIELFVTRFTDALITLTTGEKNDYLSFGIGTAARIHPIFSGIDLAPFLAAGEARREIRAELGLSDSHCVCGTVARLVTVKNHAMIVAAARQLDGCRDTLRFVFVGDGDLRQELQTSIDSAGLTAMFIFAGWRRDIPALLSAFDIFVMVSHNEGMGRAFVEAQAAGLPVIGSAVGGVPEVIIEGETGYLVNPNDPAGLAERIKTLSQDRARLDHMAAACRAWVNPRFSDTVMINKIETLYREIFAEKKL
jgi:glycosyltransferase involved in cell wall biosynthesis